MPFPDDIRNLLRRRDPLANITGFAGGNLRDQLEADDIVRQQNRPQLDYRIGIDDVTVLPSGKIEPRRGMPLADALKSSTGFAGGNLREQIDRQPREEPLKFIQNVPETKPLATPEAMTRPRMVAPQLIEPTDTRTRYADPIDLSNRGEPQVKPYNYGANPTDVLRQEYGAWQNYKPQKEGNRFLSALKSAGMAIRANARPGMSPGEIIGAGIGGATVGAATDKPGYYKKNWELGRAGSQYADALQLRRMQDAADQEPLRTDLLRSQMEENKAQAEKMRNAPDPQVEQERDNLRQTWANILSSGQDFSEDNPQHKELADRARKLGLTLPYGKKAGKDLVEIEVDGKKLQVTPGEALSYYGQIGKEARTTEQKQQDKYDEKLSRWEEDESKRQNELAAVDDELTSLEIEEKAAKDAADAAHKAYNEATKEDAATMGAEWRAAQAVYRSYADKKRAAQAKKRKLAQGTPKPSQRSSGRSGGQSWSASKWAQANPDGDIEAAKRAAAAKGYRVVE